MIEQTRLCLQPWDTINVGADGKVYPCCVSTDDLVIGTLSSSTIEEIVHGDKMAAVREQLLTGRLEGACSGCQNAPLTTVKVFTKTLNLHLATTAAATGRHDQLVMDEQFADDFHRVGSLKVARRLIDEESLEEIEIYSGFSSSAYLEKNLALAGDFTIGLWLSPEAADETAIVLHYATPQGDGWAGSVVELSVSPDRMLQSVVSSDGYANVSLVCRHAIADGWNHVTLVRASNTISAVVNGRPAGDVEFAGHFASPEALFRIGVNCAPHRGSRFVGSIGGLFIEQSALPVDTIVAVYEQEKRALSLT